MVVDTNHGPELGRNEFLNSVASACSLVAIIIITKVGLYEQTYHCVELSLNIVLGRVVKPRC